ncbi:hypothetical protein A2U01_0076607, partial [Trifolium medium]|nr:hypothetical protein [Trifolium medium]
MQSPTNQSFQLLTRAIDKSQEEIDASESVDVDASESYTDPVTATPYATDNEFSNSEALREAFSAVDVSNLCRDPELELL